MKFSKKKAALVIIIVILLVGAGFIWWNFMARRQADLPPAPPVTAPAVAQGILEDVPLAASVAKAY